MKFIKKEFSEEYRKKWNIYMDDYVQLTDDEGNLISDAVYRKSGMFSEKSFKRDKYFELIKYVEEYYDDSITKEAKKKPYLAGKHCILDRNGVEKVMCKSFSFPYIIKDSVVYSIDGHYYNIETGEYYGNASRVIVSKKFIIMEKRWAYKDDAEKGVFIIDKETGKKELLDIIE